MGQELAVLAVSSASPQASGGWAGALVPVSLPDSACVEKQLFQALAHAVVLRAQQRRLSGRYTNSCYTAGRMTLTSGRQSRQNGSLPVLSFSACSSTVTLACQFRATKFAVRLLSDCIVFLTKK